MDMLNDAWIGIRLILRHLPRHAKPEDLLKARNRIQGFYVNDGDFPFENYFSDVPSHLLRRICNAYKLSKQRQPASGPYSVSGIWYELLGRAYGPLISSAQKDDLGGFAGSLRNCFRDGTEGLSMSGDLPDFSNRESLEAYIDTYADNLLHLATFLNLSHPRKQMDNEGYIFDRKLTFQELWKQICDKAGVSPSYPRVGNPFGLRYENCAIPKVAARHLHTALRVRELSGSKRSIVDLGGGFGGVQYYLARLMDRISIISLDIPEINMISAYFLSLALPDVQLTLYGENHSTEGGRSIRILPNWYLQEIKPESVSVVVNTDSFPEIPKEASHEYLTRIGKICNYFYSENQDCGLEGQHRLSQLNLEQFGLRCLDYHIAWMRHGYFERVYESLHNHGNL
jgi:hypothetical protein